MSVDIPLGGRPEAVPIAPRRPQGAACPRGGTFPRRHPPPVPPADATDRARADDLRDGDRLDISPIRARCACIRTRRSLLIKHGMPTKPFSSWRRNDDAGVSLPPPTKEGSAWQALLQAAGRSYSTHFRSRRAQLFRDRMAVQAGDRVLDLGGWDGTHFASLRIDADIYLADIDKDAVESGAQKFGFTPVHIPPDGRLPFPDGFFDVVFCSSVIEHVTVPENELRSVTRTREFTERARASQRQFAQEIRRLGRHYFVQTPYRYFPIEAHTWMPGVIVVLPRAAQIRLIDWGNRWWAKSSIPDFHLLNARELRDLFPDAEVVRERSFGLTKSVIAVK